MAESKYRDEKWIGQKFGRLTVLRAITVKRGRSNRTLWETKCDCGNIHVAVPTDIVKGKCRSCGCFHDERCTERAAKFKHSVKDNKRLYSIYNGIKNRCFNKNEPRYKDYGGRGITMCDEWREDFDSFADWALANGYTEELTIERVDVNGNYCPENCTWITRAAQRENRRDTVWVVYKGERIQLYKLCERLGLCYDTMNDRIVKRKWDVERAISAPSERENSLSQKARDHGLNPATVHDRIYKFGWSEERALNTPTIGRGAHSKSYSKE